MDDIKVRTLGEIESCETENLSSGRFTTILTQVFHAAAIDNKYDAR